MPRSVEAFAFSATAVVEAARRCGGHPEFLAELKSLYTAVDTEVAAAGATCFGGGGCCRFDRASHRVFLSGGELGLLAERPPQRPEMLRAGRCGYQVGPRCTARARRPLGCRTFFCRGVGPDFSAGLYERTHARIRSLHQRLDLPYAYAELTTAMAELFFPAEKDVDSPFRRP